MPYREAMTFDTGTITKETPFTQLLPQLGQKTSFVRVRANYPSWIRIYESHAAMVKDSFRQVGIEITGRHGLACEVIMNTVIQDVHMKTWGFMDRVKDQTPIIRIDSLIDSPCVIHSIVDTLRIA